MLPGAQGELPYPEWALLVSGLMDDTPLGRVVAARAEHDPAALREQTPWQRAERARWQAFLYERQPPAARAAALHTLESAMSRLFG